jgi:hypothetical protein
MKGTRKSRCKRNQSGGGLGGVVEFAPAGDFKEINNPIAYTQASSCLAATRFGTLPPMAGKGLPGMSGGRRKKRSMKKERKQKQRVQKGGRYTMGAFDGVGMGAPWGSGRGPIDTFPCEASRSAIPPSGASGSLNTVGGPLWDGPVLPKGQMGGRRMKGGAAPVTDSYMLGPAPTSSTTTSSSPSEMVPTARYMDNPAGGPIVSSAGTNIMIHKPINYAEMNPACKGGARKKSKKSKKSRKSKKSKKSKGSRKSRK